MSASSSHIPIETLANLAEDQITREARDAAMLHVSACSGCEGALTRLRFVIGMMRRDTSQDAPRDVLASAINLFPHGIEAEPASLLRRVLATLTFDSLNNAAAFGLRSGHAATRQMLYASGDGDLDLRLSVQNERCVVVGQVIREGCSAGNVSISGEAGAAEARLNELCEFTLPAVPPGRYSLKVRMPDLEIEVAELELKA